MTIPILRPPRIALSPGEPAGIGPDLCVLLAQTAHAAELIAISDPRLLYERAEHLHLPIQLLPFDPQKPPCSQPPGTLYIDTGTERPTDPQPTLTSAVVPGQLNPEHAVYVLDTLTRACDGCLQGYFDAMVTAPVHKAIINDAGLDFIGHTEFLAERLHANPVMMLTAPGLRVALATTHLPLRKVADALTGERLTDVIATLERELRSRFAVPRPRILVCGLNPHAGEGGHLGREEIDIIIPVLDRCADLDSTSICKAHCQQIPLSYRNSWRRSTRCWPCITTRVCRCSNIWDSARRSMSPLGCPSSVHPLTTAPRWIWLAAVAPKSAAWRQQYRWQFSCSTAHVQAATALSEVATRIGLFLGPVW